MVAPEKPVVPRAHTVPRRAADRASLEKSRLNAILLDNMPWPALVLRPESFEIVASNRTARLEGAEPGLRCHSAWRGYRNRCPGCLAPEAWRTGEERRRLVERGGRLLDTRWVPVDDGMFLHYAIDVTEHRRMEASLRESEKLFRDTFERAAAGIVHLAPGGRFLRVNPRYCEITGYSAEELLGMRLRQLILPEDRARDRAVYRRLFAGEADTVTTEKRYVRKDGRVVWVRRTASPVRSDDGRVRHLVVVVEDIDARKRAEESLTRSRDQLRLLASHVRDAVENERRRVAREVHDVLGQGLMGLKLDTAWLSENLGGRPETLRERMAEMTESIDDILRAVKRISMELRPVLLDDLGLGAAIEWQADDFGKRRGIACRVSLSPRDIGLDPDRSTALFRIFQEMLSNVGRHAGASNVSVRLERRGSAVTLSVRDDGFGIPSSKIHDPRSIGLTGMRERLRPFGGELRIRAARGGGTVVAARIPLGREAAG